MTDPLSPETVAVYRYIGTGKSNCGGTLISNNYADRRLQTEATALDVIIHPEYFASNRNAKFDIGVVKINPIGFNKNTKRMPIYDGPVYEGQNLLAMGWGAMEDGAKDPDMMRGVLVIAGNSTMCQRFVPEFKDNNDTCQGDSGTGLAIAVGGKMMFAVPCGNPTGAEFFVRISYQLDFIMKNTGLSKEYLLGEVDE
ncbi:trypsin-like cysteine/serine peptidase domain-containing protein [Kickxella alabastrina]|uniref:trypsin-like cysteine/serine peptidase domain-containing protein n=1 Tax=Kickxella alabastrina TaxID=61397 RepID=UPI00221EBFAC|nr:trypsin-like cysteine/serine peptidase domain-containing protein [Kickxella alabastrina]KAI7820755.1 trypsin-like cysteine/serine peptidase domain-containing protein [Kickxella alabastrina]